MRCVFHSCQLLTRGMIKELVRLKNEKYLDQIKEWLYIRRLSLNLEKEEACKNNPSLRFEGPQAAWTIYLALRKIFSGTAPKKISHTFTDYLNTVQVNQWEGGEDFKLRCTSFLPKRALTEKGLKYFSKKVYRTWRRIIREIRKKAEEKKTEFNDVKYLVVKNPLNMSASQSRELRRLLKVFPWLRPIRKILVKFYYQFRLAPEKRRSLNFLRGLISEESHPWLKSAVNTLIENEEKVFRFQVVQRENPHLKEIKAIKVVNEPTMKKINTLYRTQNGMRTLENLVMRTSHYLDCPLIVVPSLQEN